MSVGYDKLNLNHELLLGLTFEEMTGLITHDRAKPAHPCTLNGVPTWNSLGNGLPYLDFVAATPDYLSCPQADTVDLDFTTGDFSIVAWVNLDSVATDVALLCRGLPNTDGWCFGVDATPQFYFATFLPGDDTYTRSYINPVVTTWYFVGISRHSEGIGSIQMFMQGINVTVIAAHLDLGTANRELHIGVNDGHAEGFDGQMWYPRIWGRQLAEWEFLELFNIERHWFGV